MDHLDRNSIADLDVAGARPRRGKSRDSLFLMGSLSLADEAKPREVRVRNLSEGGLMIEITRPVAIGAAIKLALRGLGDLGGRVAWCAEGRIGIALDRRIDPMLARKPVGGGKRTPTYATPLVVRR